MSNKYKFDWHLSLSGGRLHCERTVRTLRVSRMAWDDSTIRIDPVSHVKTMTNLRKCVVHGWQFIGEHIEFKQ